MRYRTIKRILDTGMSVTGIIVLSPVLAGIALMLAYTNRGSVLFRQARPGFKGKTFTIYKFKTMRDICDDSGILLPDSRRLTGLGRFLRSTSLDELPELFNVLRGDMSIVGPRPLLVQYLPLYTEEQKRRHDVMPGITGWAQINGRNAISWEEKFNLDIWYVDHLSFMLDLKIVLLTLWKIVRREGISQPGRDTMDEFKGAK